LVEEGEAEETHTSANTKTRTKDGNEQRDRKVDTRYDVAKPVDPSDRNSKVLRYY